MTRNQLILTLVTTAFYFIAQLSIGTDVIVASLFAVAILFGILCVFAGGGLKSIFGFLNAVLIGKFLLLGIAIKILLLEPSDSGLAAPKTTAMVMALGFAGLYIGTIIQSRLYCPQVFLMNRPIDTDTLLVFSIVLFVVSYAAYFASLISTVMGNGVQVGGWAGAARGLQDLKSFSIVAPMFYFWRIDTKRWMTHPIILTMLAWSVVIGIFSTGKLEAMEPLVFFLLVGFLRYGWRDIRLWSLVLLAATYYVLIVFPYANYVRWAGGRQGNLEQRAEVTKDIFWRMVMNQEFRVSVTDRESVGSNYFGRPSMTPFARLAMVGEADRLVYATEQKHAFTGWETIIWGFQLVTPSFLYPDKPHFEAGNYLARIVGDAVPSDTNTQVSYGIMANLYNAFSLRGVLLGTTIFFGAFYYYIRLFVGEPRWDGQPGTSALLFVWLVSQLQHGIVESSLSGVIAFVSFPLSILIFYLVASWIRLFLPRYGYEPTNLQEMTGSL